MKKRLFTISNIIVFVLLVIINFILIMKYELNGSGWLIIVLAGICFFLYVFGNVCPNKTVKIIHKVSKKIYKNSNIVEIPVEIEARRIFQRRLIYLIVTTNILLILLIFAIIFN